jgi:hypothetical protein
MEPPVASAWQPFNTPDRLAPRFLLPPDQSRSAPPAARISGRLHEGKKVHFERLQPKRCPNTITLMMVVDKSPGPSA